MKKYLILAFAATIFNIIPNNSFAYFAKTIIQDEAEAAEVFLDKAVDAQNTGNKEALLQSLSAGTSALEKEATASKGDFKDKLLSQVGVLQKFAPLAKSGLLKGDVLQKAVSMVKLLLAGQRLQGLMGGSSLLGNVGSLTKNLGLMKMGMSALGGSAQDNIGGLLSSAMSGADSLGKGGMAAKAAEPAVKKQLGGLLDALKGAI